MKDKEATTEQLTAAYAKDKELVEERKSLNAVQSKTADRAGTPE